MKLPFLFLFLSFLHYQSYSQEYVPFATQDAYWINHSTWLFNPTVSYQYELNGDTTINELNYVKVFETVNNSSNCVGALREDDQRNIYFFPFDTMLPAEFVIFPSDTTEYLIYTFDDLEIGSEITFNPEFDPVVVIEIDSVQVEGVYRKSYRTQNVELFEDNWWIEGIGGTLGLFSNWGSQFEWSHYLVCYHDHFVDYINEYSGYDSCNDAVSEQQVSISVHPNPTTNSLEISNVHKSTAYRIISATGSKVAQGNTIGMVNVEQLDTGTYTLLLLLSEGWVSVQFVKN